MTEWKEYILNDIIETLIDYRGKTPPKTSRGIPLITAKVVKNGRILNPTEFIHPDYYDKWMTRGLPQKGDLLITTEAPLGEVALVTDENIALAQRIILLRGKKGKCDTAFLKYFFLSLEGQNELQSRASGTTVEGIKQFQLRQVKVLLPDYDTQCAISEVLSSLDDKIDLLTRQNKTLEDLAQAYFRKWFIEDAKKEWEEKKLGDIIVINYGKALPERERISGGIPVYSSAGVTGWHNQYLVESNGIVIGRKGTIGTIFWVPEPFYCIDTAYYIAPNDSKYDLAFVYFLLQTMDLHELNEDSAVPGLNRNTIYSKIIQLPPEDIINKFSLLSNTILQKIQANTAQIRTLTKLRDILLPKLISGEIRVKM